MAKRPRRPGPEPEEHEVEPEPEYQDEPPKPEPEPDDQGDKLQEAREVLMRHFASKELVDALEEFIRAIK